MSTILKKVSRDSIGEIISYFYQNRNDGEQLVASIEGEKNDTQNDFQNQTMIDVANGNSETRVVVISYKQRPMVDSITLYGKFDLKFSDLTCFYNTYRKSYSHYDDSYFFFFNEDRSKGPCVVSTFLDRKEMQDGIENSDIQNLVFNFK